MSRQGSNALPPEEDFLDDFNANDYEFGGQPDDVMNDVALQGIYNEQEALEVLGGPQQERAIGQQSHSIQSGSQIGQPHQAVPMPSSSDINNGSNMGSNAKKRPAADSKGSRSSRVKVSGASVAQKGVSKVGRKGGKDGKAAALSTKEFQKILRELGKSA